MIPALLPNRWPIFAFITIAAAGCSGENLLLPEPPGGENVVLSKAGGDGQVGTVGEQLQDPLVVLVMTTRDLPVRGRKVAFEFTTEAGHVTPDTAVTNDNGHAIARWELGTSTGLYSVRAKMADVEGESPTAEFSAEARAGVPDTLSPQSPVSQPGRMGQVVSSPPVVRVVDRFGNPVPDVPVAWTVLTGQGSVNESFTNTAGDGTTTVTWTLGERIGVHKLTAAIGDVTGSPVTFTVTVLF
jgi:hypothetical protein